MQGALRQALVMDPNIALAETLRLVGPRLDAAGCRWTVIASAAVALHLGDAGGVGDIDVLVDEADGPSAFAALGMPIVPGQATERFRSRLFGQWEEAPLTVELFAGFELFSQGEWQDVHVRSRMRVNFQGVWAYVPAANELAQMVRRFGREKDLARAALLSASGPFPSRSGSA